MLVKIICAYCSAEATKEVGGVNRAQRHGRPVYCGRECAGLAHRRWKTPAQRKAEKQAYDARRRAEKADDLKAAKREYHKRTYNPARAAVERKKRAAKHAEYCRRPEYREWKSVYDRQHRAVKNYGDFADCFFLVLDIRDECLRQMTDYEIRMAKGTFGKTQQRKRDYARTLRKEPEIGPLGHLEFRQGRQNGSLSG